MNKLGIDGLRVVLFFCVGNTTGSNIATPESYLTITRTLKGSDAQPLESE